jgi:hypothetical protein
MTNNLYELLILGDYPFIIIFTTLQHAFFIGFTVGKTLKKRHPKMVTNPCRSLATNPMNLRILLQSTTKSDYQSTTSRPSFGLQSVATPTCQPLLVDLFEKDVGYASFATRFTSHSITFLKGLLHLNYI